MNDNAKMTPVRAFAKALCFAGDAANALDFTTPAQSNSPKLWEYSSAMHFWSHPTYKLLLLYAHHRRTKRGNRHAFYQIVGSRRPPKRFIYVCNICGRDLCSEAFRWGPTKITQATIRKHVSRHLAAALELFGIKDEYEAVFVRMVLGGGEGYRRKYGYVSLETLATGRAMAKAPRDL